MMDPPLSTGLTKERKQQQQQQRRQEQEKSEKTKGSERARPCRPAPVSIQQLTNPLTLVVVCDPEHFQGLYQQSLKCPIPSHRPTPPSDPVDEKRGNRKYTVCLRKACLKIPISTELEAAVGRRITPSYA